MLRRFRGVLNKEDICIHAREGLAHRVLGDRRQQAASIHQHTQAAHAQTSTQATWGQVYRHTDKI